MLKYINGQPLSGFTVLLSDDYASEVETLYLELARRDIRLHVSQIASFRGGNHICFANSCNSYYGYRCALRVRQREDGLQVILDGETPQLRAKAVQMFLSEIEAMGIYCTLPENSFGYLWNNEQSSGMRMIRLQKEVREDGITYYEVDYKTRVGKLVRGYAVAGDPAKTRLAVEAAPSGTTRTVPVHAVNAENRGQRVLAGANAGFFHLFSQNSDLTPYGPQIVDGKVLCPPSTVQRYGDLYVGCTYDNEVIVSDCETYFKHWEGKLRYAVGGGPVLMRDGRLVQTETGDSSVPSHFPKAEKVDPRTFFAHCKDGTIVILCVDGRQESSAGMTFADQVQFAMDLDLDCVDVFNFDGGGSTTIVLRDKTGQFVVKNSPCSDPIRPVADAIFLVEK